MNILHRTTLTLLTFLISATGYSAALAPNCTQSILKKIEGCQSVTSIGEFEVDKINYSLAKIDCRDGDNEIAQLAIVEHRSAKECIMHDVDTSFVEYMYGVSADLKSKLPNDVFAAAIKAELKFTLKDKPSRIEYAERLRQRAKLGEATKDQAWVLKYLDGENKKP